MMVTTIMARSASFVFNRGQLRALDFPFQSLLSWCFASLLGVQAGAL